MRLLERRFSIGDVIMVSGEAEGIVEKIGVRSTLIRQFDSNLVMIPNFKFAEQSVTNYTRRKNRRIKWIIGLEYRTTVDQIKNIRNKVLYLRNNVLPSISACPGRPPLLRSVSKSSQYSVKSPPIGLRRWR